MIDKDINLIATDSVTAPLDQVSLRLDAMLLESTNNLDSEHAKIKLPIPAEQPQLVTPEILRTHANAGLEDIASRRSEQRQSMQAVEEAYRTALEKDLAFQREMTTLEAMHRAVIAVLPDRCMVYTPRETGQMSANTQVNDSINQSVPQGLDPTVGKIQIKEAGDNV